MLFLLPVAYGAADRLWGAARPDFKGKKAVLALVLVVLGYLVTGWTGALFACLWLVYRSIPFKGGAGAPETAGQRVAAFVRHLPVLPAALLIAYWRGLPLDRTGLVFAAYVLAATSLAVAYGLATLKHRRAGEPGGAENAALEVARGVAFGLAVAVTVSA